MIFFSFFLSSAFALTLEKVLNSVEQFYPTLLAAQEQLNSARFEEEGSLGAFDPVLRLNSDQDFGYYQNNTTGMRIEKNYAFQGMQVFSGYNLTQGKLPVYKLDKATTSQGSAYVGLKLALLQGRQTDAYRTAWDIAQKKVRQTEQVLFSQKRALLKQAACAYWDWYMAGKKSLIAQDLLSIAQQRTEFIKTRIQHGDLASIELTDNDRAVFQREAFVASAQRAFQKMCFELSLFYRDDKGDPVSLSIADVQDQNIQQRFDQAMQETHDQKNGFDGHPDMKIFTSEIDQLDSKIRLASNQILPKVDIKLFGTFDFGSNPGLKVAGVLPYIPNREVFESKIGISVFFPLFFRKSSSERASFFAQVKRAEHLRMLLQQRLTNQQKDAIVAMQTAQQRYFLALKEVELCVSLEESEKRRAFMGDSSILIVTIREQTTRDAMLRRVEAIGDFFKAYADFQFSTVKKSSSNDPLS
jgi:outer membrane protein TolC